LVRAYGHTQGGYDREYGLLHKRISLELIQL